MGLIGCAAGSATSSALNGGSGWDVLKGGLMGAGMGLVSYAAGVHSEAKAEYDEYNNQDPMKDFSKDALDDVYDRQLSISQKDGAYWDKQEFYIINDSQGERSGLSSYDITSDNNSVPGLLDSDAKILHTHHPSSEFRGPSDGDIKSLNKHILSKNFRAYELDTKTSTIYEYDQSGVKPQIYKYDRNVSYEKYWNKHFKW